MRRGKHRADWVVGLFLSAVLVLSGVARGQAVGWGPSVGWRYGGYWGGNFGQVGGPVVTNAGYLYPVYQAGTYQNLVPFGFVNGGPALVDWDWGYARTIPSYWAGGRPVWGGMGAGIAGSAGPVSYAPAAPLRGVVVPRVVVPGVVTAGGATGAQAPAVESRLIVPGGPAAAPPVAGGSRVIQLGKE